MTQPIDADDRDWHPPMDGMCGHPPQPQPASAGFFMRTVQTPAGLAQGEIVWTDGNRAVVRDGARRIEGRLIERWRRDDRE